jgi:putative flavoprotein involved in K+ transport
MGTCRGRCARDLIVGKATGGAEPLTPSIERRCRLGHGVAEGRLQARRQRHETTLRRTATTGQAAHSTVLSGRIHGQVPFDIEGKAAHVIFPVLFFLAKHLVTMRTPLGRKIRPEVRAHGGPLIRVRRADLARVGVEMVPAWTVGVRHGQPVLDGGRVLDVANVMWRTGFRQDFTWIDLPVTGDNGWPLESRGVVPSSPGLYFAGLAFQYAFASMLVGGAGRDARYVVKHLCARTPADRRMDSVLDAA